MVKILITVLVSWNRSRKKNYRLISYRIFRNLLNHSKRILLLLYKEQSAVVSLGSTPIWTNPNWTTPCWMNNKLTNKFEKKLILDYPLGILEYPHWVDQSEAASRTIRHVLSLPLFLFSFALNHWTRGWVMSHYHVENLPCLCCHDNFDQNFGNFDDNDDKKYWKTYKYC